MSSKIPLTHSASNSRKSTRRSGPLIGNRRHQKPDGRADTRATRNDDAVDTQLVRQPCRVQRRRTAKRDKCSVCCILTVFDRMDACGVGHVLVDDLVDARRSTSFEISKVSAISAFMAATARSGNNAILPPANPAGSIRPITTSASVTVADSLPLP